MVKSNGIDDHEGLLMTTEEVEALGNGNSYEGYGRTGMLW